MKSEPAKRAIKSTEKKLHRSALHKNLVVGYRYNKYMVHHYMYMTKVVEVCEPKSYTEVTKGRKLVCRYGGRDAHSHKE